MLKAEENDFMNDFMTDLAAAQNDNTPTDTLRKSQVEKVCTELAPLS